MPRYHVTGANRLTGDSATKEFLAASPDDAMQQAMAAGLVVAGVQAVDEPAAAFDAEMLKALQQQVAELQAMRKYLAEIRRSNIIRSPLAILCVAILLAGVLASVLSFVAMAPLRGGSRTNYNTSP